MPLAGCLVVLLTVFFYLSALPPCFCPFCTAAVLLAGRKARGFEPVDLVVVGLVGGSDANRTLSVLNCCSAYDVHRSQGARL